MKARMDSQQVRLDSLEDLLDVMPVGNPVMQRMNIVRRKRNESFTTKPPLRRTFNNKTSFDVNSS
uniref:Uncharacterized protein n=1 Tax=Brassica oleracea var. oleracea TaxID=109376 RepID=A0A0D3B8I1_BRAOL